MLPVSAGVSYRNLRNGSIDDYRVLYAYRLSASDTFDMKHMKIELGKIRQAAKDKITGIGNASYHHDAHGRLEGFDSKTDFILGSAIRWFTDVIIAPYWKEVSGRLPMNQFLKSVFR
jgi:hypothetical protein